MNFEICALLVIERNCWATGFRFESKNHSRTVLKADSDSIIGCVAAPKRLWLTPNLHSVKEFPSSRLRVVDFYDPYFSAFARQAEVLACCSQRRTFKR